MTSWDGGCTRATRPTSSPGADPGPVQRRGSRALKVAIYNRFLQSMGGGERHSSMLAQILAAEGHEVDLVGHEDVGKEVLADHLGLNLGKVALRVVPDRGETSVAELSSQYELFVSASYMSRVPGRAA